MRCILLLLLCLGLPAWADLDYRLKPRQIAEGTWLLEGSTDNFAKDNGGNIVNTAFIVTVRIYRGGGLTKDAQYLRGLQQLLAYLRGEGTLEPLFVGKLGLSHIQAVQELVLRGVLQLPPVKPRWLSDLSALERLGASRRMGVMDQVETIER